MSLRSFHLLFIALSAVLAAFFAAWAVEQYRTNQEVLYVVTSILAVATTAGLVAYAVAFQRKTRGL